MSENGTAETEPKGEMHVGYGKDTMPHRVLDFIMVNINYVSGAEIQSLFKCLSPSTVVAAARKIALREGQGEVSRAKKIGISENGRPYYGWKWIPNNIEEADWAEHGELRNAQEEHE